MNRKIGRNPESYASQSPSDESGRDELTPRQSDYFRDYLDKTSFAMSLIRGIECDILSGLEYKRPVLDLGCGDGLFASILFDGKVDHGLDISAGEVARARSSGMYNGLVRGKSDALPYGDDSFYTVYSNCVIEHLAALDASFREVRRVLKPGGVFYCTTHSDHYRDYFFYSSLLKKWGLDGAARKYSDFWVNLWKHHNCLKGAEWELRLKKAGFSEAKASPYFPPKAVHAFDLGLPLAAPSFLLRKLTGRWKLFPRLFTKGPMRRLIDRVTCGDIRAGDWCYLLVAKKK